MNKNEVVRILEEFASPDTQENWDNSGWQVKLANEDVENVMVCVSVTDDVLNQAIEKKANLIVSHHPMIFPNIKTVEDPVICKAVQNGIQIYSLHTSFDKAGIGTSGFLANELGFYNLERIDDYVQIADLEQEIAIDNLIIKIKLALNIEKVKLLSYDTAKMIKRVAFVAGSGGSFIEKLNDFNIDLFVTSDIKYHDEMKPRNYIIIDVGHLESERPALKKIVNLLNDTGMGIFTANEKSQKIYL